MIVLAGLYLAGLNLVLRNQLEAIGESSGFRLDYGFAYAILPRRVTIRDLTISRRDAPGSLTFERARLRIGFEEHADCSLRVKHWDGRGLTVESLAASARFGGPAPEPLALASIFVMTPRATLCIEELVSDLYIVSQEATLRGRQELRAERIRLSEDSFTAGSVELAIREGQFDAAWSDALSVREPIRARLSASGLDWRHGMLRARRVRLVAETLALDLNGHGTAWFRDVAVEDFATSPNRGTAWGAVRAHVIGASALLAWAGLPELSLYFPGLDEAPLTLHARVERSPEAVLIERVTFEVADIEGRGAWRIQNGESEGALVVRRGGASMGLALQASRMVHELSPDERWLSDTLEQLDLH